MEIITLLSNVNSFMWALENITTRCPNLVQIQAKCESPCTKLEHPKAIFPRAHMNKHMLLNNVMLLVIYTEPI